MHRYKRNAKQQELPVHSDNQCIVSSLRGEKKPKIAPSPRVITTLTFVPVEKILQNFTNKV